MCVDRLNEGLHVKNIDGVFMLRPTSSPIIYFQQMGRALSSGHKGKKPLIFDFVNNYNSVKAGKIKKSSNNKDNETDVELDKECESLLESNPLYIDFMNSASKYNLNSEFTIFNQSFEFNTIIDKLNEKLNFNLLEEKWNYNFELCKEFVQKYNRLPKHVELYKGVNTGFWLFTQKTSYKQGKLSKERQHKLESIGVNFDNNLSEEQWNYNFELCKEFLKKYNRLPKQTESYKELNIGRWLNNQKNLYKQGKLSKERQHKLESIGVNFDNNLSEEQWNYNFELCKEFLKKYNRLPKQTESYKELNIGRWLNNQKNLYKQGKLSKERQHKLESIVVKFNKN